VTVLLIATMSSDQVFSLARHVVLVAKAGTLRNLYRGEPLDPPYITFRVTRYGPAALIPAEFVTVISGNIQTSAQDL
jgi:hypothetical protein